MEIIGSGEVIKLPIFQYALFSTSNTNLGKQAGAALPIEWEGKLWVSLMAQAEDRPDQGERSGSSNSLEHAWTTDVGQAGIEQTAGNPVARSQGFLSQRGLVWDQNFLFFPSKGGQHVLQIKSF